MRAKSDIRARLGTRLRRLRERRNWGQDDLSAASGISREYISRLENGRQDPGLLVLESLAGALGMTVAQLMRGV